MSSIAPTTVAGQTRSDVTTSSVRFFFVAHLALLLAVLAGFAHSFYLRPLFRLRPLPPILYLHGAVLTGWFILIAVQGWLALTQNFRAHRRTGFVLATYATLVVAMGLVADLRMATEITSPRDGDNIVFWGNLFGLILYATYVSLALLFRKSPEVHKRLVLLASFAIVGPALARFADILPGGPAARPLYGIGGILALYISLIVFDVIVRRRPHLVSSIGMLAALVLLGMAGYLAFSGVGFAILHGT